MLKLDDVSKLTERWQKTAKFIHDEGVKASFGVIGSPMEKPDPKLIAWVKEETASKTIEFWCHGYDTEKDGFVGTGYDKQLKALQRCQELAKEQFGFEYAAFGPHWSGTDADTDRALEAIPAFRAVFFYGPKPGSTSSKTVIARRMEMELPTFIPNFAHVQKQFEGRGKAYDYLALQGHANKWDDERFAEFQKIVRYLKAQGCTFMTVSEWLASPRAAGKPDADPR